VGTEVLQFSKESRALAQATTDADSSSDDKTAKDGSPDALETAPDSLGTEAAEPETKAAEPGTKANGKKSGSAADKELSQEEQRELDKMKTRDREVRTHEQAHKAVGGSLAGSIHLSYQTGPDGKLYADGGSVPIDLSSVPGDLDATIRKMERVQAAALAPASPSGPDQQIAADAAATAAQARLSLAKERFTAMANDNSASSGPSSLLMTA
jgi:hypothetical protein